MKYASPKKGVWRAVECGGLVGVYPSLAELLADFPKAKPTHSQLMRERLENAQADAR